MKLSRHGFTLIELLVVVAILAMLMSILLPSIASAKEKAKATLCLNNLRNIAQAILTYSADNKEMILPWNIDSSNPKYPDGDFWANMLVRAKLLSANDAGVTTANNDFSIFRCPNGINEEVQGWPTNITNPPDMHRAADNFRWIYHGPFDANDNPKPVNKACARTWYALNAGNHGRGQPPFTLANPPTAVVSIWGTITRDRLYIWKLSEIKRPNETVLAFDGAQANAAYYGTSRVAGRHPLVSADGTQGTCNMAFLGGSAKGINTADWAGQGLANTAYLCTLSSGTIWCPEWWATTK